MTPTAAGVSGARPLLDAYILYPIRICDFIPHESTAQRPIVSDTILEEAHRTVVADRPRSRRSADRASFRQRTPRNGRTRDADSENVSSTMRSSTLRTGHVIAAAQFHQVDVVVSNDRRLRREVDAWAKQSELKLVALSADALVERMIKDDKAAGDVAR